MRGKVGPRESGELAPLRQRVLGGLRVMAQKRGWEDSQEQKELEGTVHVSRRLKEKSPSAHGGTSVGRHRVRSFQ